MLDQTVRRIVTINTGSSSLKLALYDMGREETRALSGEVERIGLPASRWHVTDAQGASLIDQEGNLPDHGAALGVVLAWLRPQHPELRLDAVGHRIVHGGTHSEPQRITPELTADLQRLAPLAPDHMPQALQAIWTIGAAYPDLAQVACFDTAFHRRMPPTAQLYPLPRHLGEEGVVRYGFHGLSYESIMQALRAAAPQEA
jgi:acetate kinase